jgi:hypothetical protein
MRKLVGVALAAWLVAGAAMADEICSDRPDKATGTCTVKEGHWNFTDTVQDSSFHANGTDTDQYLFLAPTIKYGLNQRLDLEAYMPVVENITSHTGTSKTEVTGNGDLTLRAKYKVMYTQGGGGPPLEFAIEPFVRAPTGHHGLTDRVWEGGVLIPVGYRLSNTWLLGFDPEVDFLKDKVGSGTHLATQQVVSLSHSVSGPLTISGELWTEYNFDPARGTIRQYSADLVFAYVLAKHFEIDTGVNLGLNRNTPATQFFVGISKRY